MGPVQNLVGNVKDDEVVRKFKHAINTARSICGTAFGIEHHALHRAPGDKERQMRPYGSSLFMKWPDFGYGLKPTEEEDRLRPLSFRRPRVRSRAWPERLPARRTPWSSLGKRLSQSRRPSSTLASAGNPPPLKGHIS